MTPTRTTHIPYQQLYHENASTSLMRPQTKLFYMILSIIRPICLTKQSPGYYNREFPHFIFGTNLAHINNIFVKAKKVFPLLKFTKK